MTMRMPTFKFPMLLPPPGMMQQGGGGGSGGNSVDTRTSLMGPLSAAEVVAHYVKALETAGWKMGTVASSGDVSVVSAQAKDPDGALWRGALVAERVGENQLEASIRMVLQR